MTRPDLHHHHANTPQLASLLKQSSIVVFLRKHGAHIEMDNPSDEVMQKLSKLGHLGKQFGSNSCAKPVDNNTR